MYCKKFQIVILSDLKSVISIFVFFICHSTPAKKCINAKPQTNKFIETIWNLHNILALDNKLIYFSHILLSKSSKLLQQPSFVPNFAYQLGSYHQLMIIHRRSFSFSHKWLWSYWANGENLHAYNHSWALCWNSVTVDVVGVVFGAIDDESTRHIFLDFCWLVYS